MDINIEPVFLVGMLGIAIMLTGVAGLLYAFKSKLHKFWQAYFAIPALLWVSHYLDPESFSAWLATFILMNAKAIGGCALLYAVQRIYMAKRSHMMSTEHALHLRLVMILCYGLVIAGSLIN